MSGPNWSAIVARSPLTDPRSLGSSLVFHALLLAVASVVALSAVAPMAPELQPTLRGEIGPVDNRAPSQGGGSPGELGGEGLIAALPTADGTSPEGGLRDPAADALLSEILPTPATADDAQRALPGPQITGLGVLPGPGRGGGGGSGGGSGGGVGRGVGPGTEFFGAREHALSFTYVIDCSGSMATRNALEVAKRELLTSLNQLPPDAQFGVIFYNLNAFDPVAPRDKPSLMAATAANKDLIRTKLAADRARRRHRPHARAPHGPDAAHRGHLLPDRRRPHDQQRRLRDPRAGGPGPDPVHRVRPRHRHRRIGAAPSPGQRHRRLLSLPRRDPLPQVVALRHRPIDPPPPLPPGRAGAPGAGSWAPAFPPVSRLLSSRSRAGCV